MTETFIMLDWPFLCMYVQCASHPEAFHCGAAKKSGFICLSAHSQPAQHVRHCLASYIQAVILPTNNWQWAAATWNSKSPHLLGRGDKCTQHEPGSTLITTTCKEMRGVDYRQMVSKAAHKDLVPARWNDVRWDQLSSHRGVWQKSEPN